jgi:hypothetical protein
VVLASQARLPLGFAETGAQSGTSSGAGQARSTAGGDDGAVAESERRHWAFIKPVRPQVPVISQSAGARTPLDAFVLAGLGAKRLGFSPEADRRTLLRRACLDLLGLPPAPQEIERFLADERPDAYERMLDRLLASPHFGERWGRHWLDVAGYTDTVGFDIDAALIIQSEGKWRYRDYVIRSFNQDKPYTRFVAEQLAGDELVDWRGAHHFTPEIRELLIATGFLRTAQDYSHEPESNIPLNHFAVLHDTVEIIGSSLLGLTLNCARCHTHKFDPVPQEDYYRMMALLTPAYNPMDWRAVTPYKPEIQDRSLPDVSAAERAEIERHNSELDRQVSELNQQLAQLQRPHEQRLFEIKLAAIPEPIRADTRTALETPAEHRTEIQKYLVSKLEGMLKVGREEVLAALSDSETAAHSQISSQIAALQSQRRSFGKIQALWDLGSPPATHLLLRGNHETPGPEVQPGFLSALGGPEPGDLLAGGLSDSATSGRRTALAQWLTRPDSTAAGLVARVMVNRIWQHLFGEGLVPTPENFGRGGMPPTHPELLDWLAVEFADREWQVKPLIRLIMSSAVYRQASASVEDRAGTGGPVPTIPTAAATAGSNILGEPADPENQLLWRQRLRRLESEVVRDAMLAAGGNLDPQMGGAPILLQARPDGMVIISETGLATPSSKWRRSVYLLARHQYHLSLLTVFDQPVLATNCPRRDVSAVPLQSLTMLNDAFVMDQAERFAARVIDEAGTSPDQRIELAFGIALGRMPSAIELEWCRDLLTRQAELYKTEPFSPQDRERKALVHLCQALFNSSEFLYAH